MTTSLVRRFAPAVLLLTAGSFCFQSAINFQMPALPRLLFSLGGSATQVGLVVTAGSLTAMATRLGWPVLSARFGQAWLLMAGGGVGAVAMSLYLLAGSVPAVLALRIVTATAMSCFMTVAAGAVAQVAPAERRAEVIGFYGISSPMALVVGTVVGGTLVSLRGFGIAFGTAAGLALAAVLCCLPMVRVPELRSPQATRPRTLIPPGVRRLAVAMACLVGVNGGVVYFGPSAAGVDNLGLFFAGYALAMVLSRVVGGRLADRHGYFPVAVTGTGVMTAGLLLLGLADAPWLAVAGAAGFGLGLGAAASGVTAWAVHRVGAPERGAAMGLLLLGMDIGLSVIVFGTGLVTDGLGVDAAVSLLAVPVLAAAAILVQCARTEPAPVALDSAR